MASRTIAKQDAKAVADAGGFVVWTKGTNTPGEFVSDIRMVVDAIGVDHVGIGTDDDMLSSRTGTGLNDRRILSHRRRRISAARIYRRGHRKDQRWKLRPSIRSSDRELDSVPLQRGRLRALPLCRRSRRGGYDRASTRLRAKAGSAND
jgi:hypothetical protein